MWQALLYLGGDIMDKVLEVKGVTKLYKNGRGVKDITFDIYKGDIYGFLGPNGAGKTTVMKTIVGLCKAKQGDINIFGYSIVNEFEKAMAKVGCIIETAASYEYLNAFDNLKIAAATPSLCFIPKEKPAVFSFLKGLNPTISSTSSMRLLLMSS
jgi:ABC-type multidrug transport system ATPase subunit